MDQTQSDSLMKLCKEANLTVDISQLLSVRPRMRALYVRLRLSVRVEEDRISSDTLLLHGTGDVFCLALEVHIHVLHFFALLGRE